MAGCPEAWELDIDGRYPDGSFPDDSRSASYDSRSYNDDDPPAYTYRAPKYAFNTIEELMTSPVFQTALTQALAHKDVEIRKLQEEIMARAYDDSHNT